MNNIEVEATGREIPALCDGAIIDFEEFRIISCDVEPEKGELIYDINLLTKRMSEQGGLKVPSDSIRCHISSRPLVTQQELDLLEERGVTVSIRRRVTCYRRDLPCDPLKAPPGGCASCRELKRK